MTPRIDILRPVLVRTTLIVLAAAIGLISLPASGADAATYCVNRTDVTCAVPHFNNDLQGALDKAASDTSPGPDTVLIGAGNQTTPVGFTYEDTAPNETIQIIGAGAGQTTLKISDTSASDLTLRVAGATGSSLSDLTVDISNNDGAAVDTALSIGVGNSASRIAVTGNGSDNANGIFCLGCTISDSSVNLPHGPAGNAGIIGYAGDTLITGSTVTSDVAVKQNDPGGTLVFRHGRLKGTTGAQTDGGSLDISNTLIELVPGSSGSAGVRLQNSNGGTVAMSAVLNGITVVGDGATPGSSGLVAQADFKEETTNFTMKNSAISGTAKSINLIAGDGRTVTGSTSHSAYDKSKVSETQLGVSGTIDFTQDASNIDLNGDPGFADPAAGDYSLLATSPLIDKGDPADPPAGSEDLSGHQRACHGTDAGIIRRDIGAYEYKTTSLDDCTYPETTIDSGPGATTTVSTPPFTVSTSKPGPNSAFRCTFDAVETTLCDSSFTFPNLGFGAHNLSVTAIDTFGNVDQTPATQDFTAVDTPPSCVTNTSLCPPSDKTAPVVRLLKKAPKSTKKKSIKVRFTSNEAGSTFTCQVNKAKAKKCKSPYKAKLKRGRNVIRIVATDMAGNPSKPKTVKVRRK